MRLFLALLCRIPNNCQDNYIIESRAAGNEDAVARNLAKARTGIPSRMPSGSMMVVVLLYPTGPSTLLQSCSQSRALKRREDRCEGLEWV